MRRISPALVLSVIALLVASSGTAIAAKKYLITSTHQISPKVLAQLKGARGPVGPVGTVGPAGAPGATGATGAAGAVGATGSAGTRGPAGSDSVVARTRIDYNTGGVSTTSGSYEKMVTFAPFTKQQDGTIIALSVSELAATSDDNSTCTLELRIDDQPGDAGEGTDGIVTGTSDEIVPVFMYSEFSGLSVGQHTVSIWGNTDIGPPGTECGEDVGGFPRSLFITEER